MKMDNYKYDPRVEQRGHDLVYLLQTKLALKLPDDVLWDVYSTIRKTADYWKKGYDTVMEDAYARKFNETKLWIRANPDATTEQILDIMTRVDNGQSVRGFKFEEPLHNVTDAIVYSII